MKEFGAYFQVYKNPYATYKCLESFRSFYPFNTIILVSDNGYNYTKMAEYFNCIYIHSNEQILLIYNDLTTNDYIQNSFKLIDRFINAIQLIEEDYVILLEDDVVINNKIDDELKYDINGYCPNFIFKQNDDIINNLLVEYPFLDINARYSGHGGSIFNKNNIITYLSNKPIIDIILQNWNIWHKYNIPINICQDYLYSIITIFNKGTIGPLNNHLDCNYLNTNITIQHQYKVYYNVEMPSSIKHLYDIN